MAGEYDATNAGIPSICPPFRAPRSLLPFVPSWPLVPLLGFARRVQVEESVSSTWPHASGEEPIVVQHPLPPSSSVFEGGGLAQTPCADPLRIPRRATPGDT